MKKANLSLLEYFLNKTMDLSQQLSQGEPQGQMLTLLSHLSTWNFSTSLHFCGQSTPHTAAEAAISHTESATD